MMKNKALLSAVILVSASVGLAYAQDPGSIISTADKSLQEGDLSPFGTQLRQVISQQTGGTGRYQPLIQLGSISNIAINGTYQVPSGVIVQGRVFHQNGYADWTLGFSNLTQKIEFGNFNAVVANWPNNQPPGMPDGSPPPPTTGGPPTTPPVPAGKDDACAKYPTLC